MTDTESETADRRRLSSAESDIQVLKSTAKTTTELLAGIAANQKETAQALEALRLSQWPPFLYVLTVAGIGAGLMTSVLAGIRHLNGAQIAEETRLLNYRVTQIERTIVLTPGFSPGSPKEEK